MHPLRVGVLGPLVVRRDDAPVSLGSPMLCNLVGVLAVQPHAMVSRDEIVQVLWGEQPPPTCIASMHVYMGRLRTLLDPARAPRTQGLISAVGNRGYIFQPCPGQLDLLDFAALAERAERAGRQARPAGGSAAVSTAADALSDALRCWRGPALAGVGGRLEHHPAVAALRDRRAALAQAYADVTLHLLGARQPGGAEHREQALGLLRELAHEQPLHEGVHARLMLLLAAIGQQAAALRLYAELRTRLDEELGVPPGADLTGAHLRILRHELNGPGTGHPTGTPAPPPGAGDAAAPATVRPAQLPLDVRPFTGRADILHQLHDELTGTGLPVLVVSGTAGVGKTALAVHWAHRAAEHFPGGQIFVGLRGYARTPPLRPIDALAQVLRSLGVSAEQIPVDTDDAANLYRSLLAGRRLLVVLDNASSAEQVRPLLPGTDGCAVLVTSRDRLAGLTARDGARRISVDVLAPAEAVLLLAGIVGDDRVAAEPDAAAELVRTCGYLPLALRIAAANLQSRPHLPVAAYLSRLRAMNPISALTVDGDDEAAVRAAFDLSYRALPAPAQRMFRLLGIVPGADFSEGAAAALADVDDAEAARLLDVLCGAHLLVDQGGDRFGLHDLLRAYAADRALADDAGGDRTAALDRLLTWYERGVAGATAVLYPERLRLPGVDPAAAPRFDAAAAIAWLDAERPSLLAAATEAARHDRPQTAWLMMDAMRAYCSQRVSTVDWLTLTRAGRAAAERVDDPAARAAAHLNLAEIALRQGKYRPAIADYELVVELSRRAGWLGGEAAALGNLGVVCRYVGRARDAVRFLLASLELNRRTGRVAGQAMVLGSLGIAHRELGDLDRASANLIAAVRLFREAGSTGGEAAGLNNLGEVHCAQGRLDEAAGCQADAVAMFRTLGSRANEAVALWGLAAVQCERGHTAAALELARQSLDMARETADRRIEMDALNTLGRIHARTGRAPQARGHYQHALRLARDIGHRYPEAVALVGLAELHHELGEPEVAVHWAQQALAVATAGGYAPLVRRATGVAARPALVLTDQE